jgi:hypothetical protein
VFKSSTPGCALLNEYGKTQPFTTIRKFLPGSANFRTEELAQCNRNTLGEAESSSRNSKKGISKKNTTKNDDSEAEFEEVLFTLS